MRGLFRSASPPLLELGWKSSFGGLRLGLGLELGLGLLMPFHLIANLIGSQFSALAPWLGGVAVPNLCISAKEREIPQSGDSRREIWRGNSRGVFYIHLFLPVYVYEYFPDTPKYVPCIFTLTAVNLRLSPLRLSIFHVARRGMSLFLAFFWRPKCFCIRTKKFSGKTGKSCSLALCFNLYGEIWHQTFLALGLPRKKG